MPLWAQILLGIMPSAATLGVAFLAYRQSVNAYEQSLKNSRAIQEVHLTFNSRMSEFLALTASSSKQAGIAQERKEVADRLSGDEPVKVAIVSVPEPAPKA